jgi:hypothetical protein
LTVPVVAEWLVQIFIDGAGAGGDCGDCDFKTNNQNFDGAGGDCDFKTNNLNLDGACGGCAVTDPIWVPDPCPFRVLDCSTNVSGTQ